MEHITTTDLGNGNVRLQPDKGYMLFDRRTQRRYSEAVVESGAAKFFTAVR